MKEQTGKAKNGNEISFSSAAADYKTPFSRFDEEND